MVGWGRVVKKSILRRGWVRVLVCNLRSDEFAALVLWKNDSIDDCMLGDGQSMAFSIQEVASGMVTQAKYLADLVVLYHCPFHEIVVPKRVDMSCCLWIFRKFCGSEGSLDICH